MTVPCPPVFVLAVVGAECGGKSHLAAALAGRLTAGGAAVRVVDEYLREFCDVHGRTPRVDEQAAIAAEQTRRIEAARRELSDEAAAGGAGVVVADTTALMTAVYSDIVFGDDSLYAAALRDHGRCGFTLLASPDLPWQADGIQRSGERMREAIDSKVRAALRRAGAAFAVIGGAARRAPRRPGRRWSQARAGGQRAAAGGRIESAALAAGLRLRAAPARIENDGTGRGRCVATAPGLNGVDRIAAAAALHQPASAPPSHRDARRRQDVQAVAVSQSAGADQHSTRLRPEPLAA